MNVSMRLEQGYWEFSVAFGCFLLRTFFDVGKQTFCMVSMFSLLHFLQ